jgi:hypothetical protein
MSSGKFASITAGLLARKGEAQPWPAAAAREEPSAPLVFRPAPLQTRSAPPPPPPGREKTCSLRLSAQDFERLGILAVKSGTTRQQLMKQALAQLLADQAREYGCACMGNCDRDCGSTG